MSTAPRMRPRPRLVRRSTPSLPMGNTPHETHRSQPRPRYSTKIVPVWFVGRVYQAVGVLLLAASFAVGVLGNVGLFAMPELAGVGSVDVWRGVTWRDIAVALAVQVVLQSCQFYTAATYGHRSRPYRFWLSTSVLPSLYTYGLVIVPWLGSAYFWGDAWPVRLVAYGMGTIALVVVLVLNDYLQESLLLND